MGRHQATQRTELTFSGNGIGLIAAGFFASGESLRELLILLLAEGVDGSSVALRLASAPESACH
jgi:hypothetical protein